VSTDDVGGDAARTAELADALRAVTQRIGAACAAVGRPPADVTLVAVTKTYPASDVVRLARLGVGNVGENRDQEASAKAAEVSAAGIGVAWHFVGQLQRNKCRSVVRYASVVESVDSVALVTALAAAAARQLDHPLDVCVQVSLDGGAHRGGAVPEGDVEPGRQLDRVLAAAAQAPALCLRGLMAVAPLDGVPERAFAALAAIAERTRATYPAATWLSAGMSADLETAVRYGSTHVRIGSALLGKRAPLR
jgi:pyridoxal phosphate enzyme (YggS family)